MAVKNPSSAREDIVDRSDLPVPDRAPGSKEIDMKGTVKYIGAATRRIITEEDWKSIPPIHGGPVEDQKGVEWSFKVNQGTLPISAFSKAALEYLKTDGRFLVTE